MGLRAHRVQVKLKCKYLLIPFCFRLVNRQREEKLAQVMTSYKDAMPSSLNIAPELWLEDPQVLPYQVWRADYEKHLNVDDFSWL